MHVPSRRALREDPDFDAVVTALYADAKDYDLRENAYSAHVAKKTMQEDKEERERERAAKKRRMEEAAAQAAAMREQYRLEAEAKRRADEEAAAARAAKEAEERRATRAAAAEAAKAAAAAAKTPKSTAGKNTIDKRPPGRPRSSSAADPASNAVATTTKPGVAVEMPDDFAGLYAVRAGDDRARAAAGHLREDIDACFSVELRRNAMDGGVGLLSRPHVRAPGSAPVGVIKKLVARDAGTAVSAVRLTAGDGAEEDLDPSITVRDALYAQLQAGERELTLRYSVV